MSDAHDDNHPDDDGVRPAEPEAGAGTTGEDPEGGPRTDPRLRPPDPAGTQPKHDPASLLPQRSPAAASASLWAPPADGDDRGEHDVRPRRADEAAADDDDADGAPALAPEYSRYSHRVQFALGALLAVGAAGIVLLVAALVGHNSSEGSGPAAVPAGPAWSSWRPASGSGVAAAQEIAEHVGRQYHLPSGHQLALVTGGPLAYGGLPATIAIQQPVATGGDVDFVDGTAVLFRLCGLGTKTCAIREGRPSAERQLLLQREALELALYAFRYLGVEEAVVLLPPAKLVRVKSGSGTTKKAPDPPAQAQLFRRSETDVQSAVAHPLRLTLAAKTPSVSTVTRSPDAETVKTMTEQKLFSFRFQSANQDASVFLVLQPYTVP